MSSKNADRLVRSWFALSLLLVASLVLWGCDAGACEQREQACLTQSVTVAAWGNQWKFRAERYMATMVMLEDDLARSEEARQHNFVRYANMRATAMACLNAPTPTFAPTNTPMPTGTPMPTKTATPTMRPYETPVLCAPCYFDGECPIGFTCAYCAVAGGFRCVHVDSINSDCMLCGR